MAPGRKSHAAGSESGHTAPRPKRQTASRRKSHAASRRKGYAALRQKVLTAPDSETACARPAAPRRMASRLAMLADSSLPDHNFPNRKWPAHSIGNEHYPFTCARVTRTLSMLEPEWWFIRRDLGPRSPRPAGARLGRWRPDMPRSLQVQGLDTGVPPVGVEPTLGTLLGGRPLPLGYGGWAMIPRSAPIIRDRAMG